MGERKTQSFQFTHNASLKVGFQGSRVTSDGGLILVRELDERLGLSALIVEHMKDDRRGKNRQLPVADQLAAAAGENRRAVDQARPVLLAPLGGESSHVTALCRRD